MQLEDQYSSRAVFFIDLLIRHSRLDRSSGISYDIKPHWEKMISIVDIDEAFAIFAVEPLFLPMLYHTLLNHFPTNNQTRRGNFANILDHLLVGHAECGLKELSCEGAVKFEKYQTVVDVARVGWMWH